MPDASNHAQSCFLNDCYLAVGHEGPHDETCSACEGKGRRVIKQSKLSCSHCGGTGRRDRHREQDWKFSSKLGYWVAQVEGGVYQPKGASLYVWTEPGRPNWTWLVRRHPGAKEDEASGTTAHRWQAMDAAEDEVRK